MEGVLPNNINLAAQKPQAVQSYTRRFKNIQTNTTGTNGENAEIIIPVDTGTPGAFMDPSACFLSFLLTIDNPNPYCDFHDFGLAGANSVFEQLQVRNNGASLETIRDYNTVFENWQMIDGQSQQAFKMYKERRTEIAEGAFSESHINSCKAPMVDHSGRIMWSSAQANYNEGINSSSNDSAGNVANGLFNFSRNQLLKPGMMYATNMGPDNINLWPAAIGVETQEYADYKSSGSSRFQDYMVYLTNVKNVPIGCTSNPNAVPVSQYGLRTQTTISPNQTAPSPVLNGKFTVNVNVPVICGTLGILADKMVPTMLLDNLQLVYYTCTYGKFFKLSMDPCRVIAGTHRDYLVYYGNILASSSSSGNNNGNFALPYYYNFQRYCGFNGTEDSESDWFNPVSQLNCSQGAVLTTAIQAQQVAHPDLNINGFMQTIDLLKNLPMGIKGANTASVMNADTQINLTIAALGVSATHNTLGSNSNTTIQVNPMRAAAVQSIIQGYSSIICCPLQAQQLANFASEGSTSSVKTTYTPYYIPTDNPYLYFPKNGLVPQYFIPSGQADSMVPCSYYGELGQQGLDVSPGPGSAGCYGTYLKASTAQTCRVIKNGLVAGQGVSVYGMQQKLPTFSVSQVVFNIRQVIIPDSTTSGILERATNGDISIQTSTIQTYSNIQLTPGSSSQNIIIPAKCASANSMYIIFRTSEQISNNPKQYLVNSLTGICPLGSLLFKRDGTSVSGTNTAPKVSNIQAGAVGGSAFSFQLKIGNDLIPQQPMTSPTELICELENCNHALNKKNNNQSFGSPVYTDPTGTTLYDLTTPGGYFTTYIDPDFLRDQTIINNAVIQYIAGQTDANTVPIDPIGIYAVNQFKHPDGGFMLGFDLDTWSGMSGVAMAGRFLGTNPIALQCEGLNLAADLGTSTNTDNTVSLSATVFVVSDARWSFQAGGSSQLFV